MIKIVKYTTIHEPDKKIELEFNVNSNYDSSKKILDYLENNVNLDLIQSITNKEFFRNVIFTTTEIVEEQELEFSSIGYKNTKEIFDYLNKNFDIDFIHEVYRKEKA